MDCCDGSELVEAELSPEGSGLLRESTSCVWDEEGVPEGDCVEPCEGEAVPELESFFLEGFLSLARESCSC